MIRQTGREFIPWRASFTGLAYFAFEMRRKAGTASNFAAFAKLRDCTRFAFTAICGALLWPELQLVIATLTICPAPAGIPNPRWETYNWLSGPKAMAVGNVRPLAMVVRWPLYS